MNLDTSTDKVWLIKSAGMILGPFSLEEVIHALKEKKLSIIDDIRSPIGRWGFIREHPQFSQVVQFLRDQESLTKEDTGLITAGSKTVTNTITAITGDLLAKDKEDTDCGQPDLTVPAVEVLEAAHARPQEARQAPAESTYAFNADHKVQKSLSEGRKRFTKMAWITLGAVLLAIVGLQMFKQRDSAKALGFDDYLRLAKSNKSVGQPEKSLEFYRKAELSRPLPVASRLQMITLMMLVENQNVQARQYLEQILVNERDEKLKEEGQNLLALSYLREGQLDEAQKRYEELLLSDTQNEPAKMNLVEISILQGQFDVAYKNLTNLLKDGGRDNTLTLYRGLATYRASAEKANEEKLESALSDFKRYLGKTQDFKMETLLLTAAIQGKLGKTVDAGLTVKEILSTNPDQTREHLHDDLIHREILEWSYLGQICALVLKEMPVSSYSMGLQALCSYQQADMKSAMEQIDKARSQFGSEPILYGLQAFLLVKSGRGSEASGLWKLDRADESDLLISVHARWCMEQREWGCAETQWQKLFAKQPNSVDALYGLAKTFMERGKKERALDYIQQGLLASGNYRPLVILKGQINEP